MSTLHTSLVFIRSTGHLNVDGRAIIKSHASIMLFTILHYAVEVLAGAIHHKVSRETRL